MILALYNYKWYLSLVQSVWQVSCSRVSFVRYFNCERNVLPICINYVRIQALMLDCTIRTDKQPLSNWKFCLNTIWERHNVSLNSSNKNLIWKIYFLSSLCNGLNLKFLFPVCSDSANPRWKHTELAFHEALAILLALRNFIDVIAWPCDFKRDLGFTTCFLACFLFFSLATFPKSWIEAQWNFWSL